MVPTKPLWLLLDVIISSAGSQTSEHGSVSETNKPQGFLSGHGKSLIWAGSSLLPIIPGQAVQLFLGQRALHRGRYQIPASAFCFTTDKSKTGLLNISLKPVPGEAPACAASSQTHWSLLCLPCGADTPELDHSQPGGQQQACRQQQPPQSKPREYLASFLGGFCIRQSFVPSQPLFSYAPSCLVSSTLRFIYSAQQSW